MIEFRPKGLLPADLESIVGRIVMVDGNAIFPQYVRASKVLSCSGKSLEICELASELDSAINRVVAVDRLSREDGRGVPLQMRTVKLICDTAAEVNAIRRFQDKIDKEYFDFIKAVPGRYQDMAEKLALENVPKGP